MEFTKENIKLICADNMKIMAQYPDNYFDLAVLDPEYGIKINHNIGRRKGDKHSGHKKIKWDNKPPKNIFFDEIFRISKNQIIWGGNYFSLPPCKGFIIWDKLFSNDISFSMYEFAWTSFNKTSKGFKFAPQQQNGKIHPTQKPVKLYDFCFDFANAQKDWKILDTNGGSFNSAISAYYFGFAEYVGIEIDKDYFDSAVKRFKIETSQKKIF
jgi:site-specific DNA-methyltransferase (adenine-specific)